MGNVLNLNFWFRIRPGLLNPSIFQAIIIFILILAVFSLVTYFIKRQKRGLFAKTWERLNTFSFSNLVIVSLLAFFSYEMVPLLSARFWWPLVLVEMMVWLYFIAKSLMKLPEMKKQIARRA